MAWLFGRRKQRAATVAVDSQGRPFQYMGDRRHVADAPYVLPSDDQEINRLDFQHYMLRYALRGNFAAPLTRPASILDVGSGTGRWAMEMAAYYPDANVVGVDLVNQEGDATAASLGHGLEQRPDNYVFVQGNVLNGLPFADNSFDFVHMRLLLFAIPPEKWPVVARELVRVTRPGGWVESIETGPQRNGGPAMDTLVQWITEGSRKRGIDPLLGPRVASFFAEAGLTNMATREMDVPVGRTGGRLGTMAEVDVFGVVGGVKPMMVAHGLATERSYDELMAQARADLDRTHCTLPFYVAYGQKPR